MLAVQFLVGGGGRVSGSGLRTLAPEQRGLAVGRYCLIVELMRHRLGLGFRVL